MKRYSKKVAKSVDGTDYMDIGFKGHKEAGINASD